MREPKNISKPNVDASFVFYTCQATVGAVIRNHQGAVVLAMVDHLCPCNNTEEAQALECPRALQRRSKLEWP